MRHALALLVLPLLAAPALAEDCPPPPDHSAEIDALLSDVRVARDQTEAQEISNDMWRLWADAPNEQAQEVLDRGMRKRAAFDLLGAIEDFDLLVDYCPDYAEGYNQRAFAHFIREDYEAALRDLNRALELNPMHIPAMAGRALTLMGLGDMEAAQEELRQALKIHPWLPERRMLIDQGTKL